MTDKSQIATASVQDTGPRNEKDAALVLPPSRGLNQRFPKELLENVVAILSAI